MKRIILFAALLFAAAAVSGQSRVIPPDVVVDEALTLDKGGACYAFKLNGGREEASFKPGAVFFTDKGLVVGVSAEKFQHFQHELGEKTDYFFYPDAAVNKQAMARLGLMSRIGLLYENGQWNVVAIEPVKTGGGNHVAIKQIAGNVSTTTIPAYAYQKRMAPDLWHPSTLFPGAILQGGYASSYYWPFSLYSAAQQAGTKN